jgi:hypothetical protein
MAIFHKFWQLRVDKERRDRVQRWERYLTDRGVDVGSHPMATATSIVRDQALVPENRIKKPKNYAVKPAEAAALLPGPATQPPEPRPVPVLKNFMLMPRGVGEEPTTPPQRVRAPADLKQTHAKTDAELLGITGSLSQYSAGARSMPALHGSRSSAGGSAARSGASVRSSRINALLPKVPELVAQQLRAAIDPLQEEIKEEQARRQKAEADLAALSSTAPA